MGPTRSPFFPLLIALTAALGLHAAVVLGLLHYGEAGVARAPLPQAFTLVPLPEPALAPREELPPPVAPIEDTSSPAVEAAPKPAVASEPEPRLGPQLKQAVAKAAVSRPKAKPRPRIRQEGAPRAALGTESQDRGAQLAQVPMRNEEPFSPPLTHADYLHNPRPAYPRQARQQRMQGRVLLAVRVSAEGLALSVTLKSSSGFDLLDQAAAEAVRNWRFVPALRGGSPVEGLVEVPIRFVLAGES